MPRRPNNSSFVIRHPSPRQRPAFTLIELLVVVAIIVVLIAILLPSLGKARDKARLTVCQTHLRAWAQGFHVYGGANNNFLPLDGDANNETTPVGVWSDISLWFNAIPSVNGSSTYDDLQQDEPNFSANPAPHNGLPKAGDNSLFVCPSALTVNGGLTSADHVTNGYFQTVGYTPAFAKQTRDMLLCYGMSSQLRSWNYGSSASTYPGTPKSGDFSLLTNFNAPSYSVLMVEKRVDPAEVNNIPTADFTACGTTKAKVQDQTITQTKVAPLRFTARHSNGGNIAFADAHVEWFSWKSVNIADGAAIQYEQPGYLVWNPNDLP